MQTAQSKSVKLEALRHIVPHLFPKWLPDVEIRV